MLRFARTHLLGSILVLGLLHGLLYVFLVPPWQHYDEPTHFEYAWLLANRSGLPQSGDYDQTMRRAVALSMIEHNFFRGMNFLPDLNVQGQPIWIGISQLDGRPFYYLLASLPLRVCKSWDVTRQLYAARLVSLALYLLTLVAVWGVMKELTSERSPLRWMVPLSMALLPGYTDLMTALNDDVAATALFSLFLWTSVYMIRRGISLPRLLWVVMAALLCLWTKQTVFLALPLLGLVLLFSLFRRRWRWLPWGLVAVSVPVLVFSVFSWGDASLWIRTASSLQEIPTRVYLPQAPVGEHVLRLHISPGQTNSAIFQLLPPEQVKNLQGKTATLGAWIWATKSLVGKSLIFYDGRTNISPPLQITTSRTFFSFEVVVPNDDNRAQVILSTSDWQNSGGTWDVFFDGVVLVDGSRPLDIPPKFDDPSAQQGTWGGRPFTNLLRNTSGESGGPGIRPWVEKIKPELVPAMPSPSLVLGSLLDWQGAGWYYRAAAQNLLRTFWAKFGWGHVPLNLPFTHRPYALLAIFTLAGLGGAGIALWRHRFALPWNVLLFLGIVLAGIWGQTVLRGIPSLTNYTVSIPVARYAYPVIIPTLLVLNAGWLEIAYTLERWTHLASGAKFPAHFLLFLGLDIAALSSIIHFYSMR